ncbi:hypothetical protein BKA81DRAFT_361140 [Phyllosticta paracitricarpa]
MRIFDDACGDRVDAHAEVPCVGPRNNLLGRRIRRNICRHWHAVPAVKRLLGPHEVVSWRTQGPLPFQGAKPATNRLAPTHSRQASPRRQVHAQQGVVSFRVWWRVDSALCMTDASARSKQRLRLGIPKYCTLPSPFKTFATCNRQRSLKMALSASTPDGGKSTASVIAISRRVGRGVGRGIQMNRKGRRDGFMFCWF